MDKDAEITYLYKSVARYERLLGQAEAEIDSLKKADTVLEKADSETVDRDASANSNPAK